MAADAGWSTGQYEDMEERVWKTFYDAGGQLEEGEYVNGTHQDLAGQYQNGAPTGRIPMKPSEFGRLHRNGESHPKESISFEWTSMGLVSWKKVMSTHANGKHRSMDSLPGEWNEASQSPKRKREDTWTW